MTAASRTRRIGAVAGALLVLSMSGPARADEPVPPNSSVSPEILPDSSAQPNLLIIGGVVTAVWYGAAVGTSYLWPDSPGAEPLRIPVAGPYMALAKTGCGEREPGCDTLAIVLRTILTSISAVAQTGGVIAMVEGIFLPTQDAAPARAASLLREPLGPEVHVEPMVDDANHFGFRLGGRF